MSFMIRIKRGGTGTVSFNAAYDFGDEGTPDFSTLTGTESGLVSCYAETSTLLLCTALKGFATV